MSSTTEPTLEGMPGPEPLRLFTHQGEAVVLSGRRVLFRFPAADIGMRRLAMVALTQAGQSVKAVAQAFEVHPNYLSTLRKTAREQGSAGLVKVQGRPVKLTGAQREQARRWSEQGVSGQEIARRLQVSDSLISRLVGAGRWAPEPVQDEFPDDTDTDTDTDAPTPTTPTDVAGPGVADREPPEPVAAEPAVVEPGDGLGGAVAGSSRLGAAGVDSRYAGAMLLHAFYDRVGAAAVFAPLTGAGPAPARSRRCDDVALLTATSVAFALGVGSVEATKHLSVTRSGRWPGWTGCPSCAPCDPGWPSWPRPVTRWRCRPTWPERCSTRRRRCWACTSSMTTSCPTRARNRWARATTPNAGTAQKGLADTLVTDYHGRAVCFVSGPPSGLTKTLPAALTELRRVTADAKIMLGFDRGGSYAQVFTHCRDHDVDWITYRRGTLADTTTAPRRYWRVDGAGRAEAVTLADEMITIKDYGPARQLTLFEHDQPVLQVLTSDLTAPAAALLAWLRCRWRIENVFKYLTAHHGMDWLCHYEADLAPDTTPIDNPARKQARDAVKRAETTLADAQRALTRLLRCTDDESRKGSARGEHGQYVLLAVGIDPAVPRKTRSRSM